MFIVSTHSSQRRILNRFVALPMVNPEIKLLRSLDWRKTHRLVMLSALHASAARIAWAQNLITFAEAETVYTTCKTI